MRTSSFLLFLLSFTLCLVPGFWMGRWSYPRLQRASARGEQALRQMQVNWQERRSQTQAHTQPAPSASPTLAHTPAVTTSPANQSTLSGSALLANGPVHSTAENSQQRNLLILTVDDLQASAPNLLSAWLVLSYSGTTRFILLPVYPTVPGGDPEWNQALPASFKLEKGGALGQTFVDHLKAKELWWSTYLVLDQDSLASILIEAGAPAESIARAIDDAPDPTNYPVEAIQIQARFYQQICQSPLGITGAFSWFQPTNGIPITDLELEQESERLQAARAVPYCEFPSLIQFSSP